MATMWTVRVTRGADGATAKATATTMQKAEERAIARLAGK